MAFLVFFMNFYEYFSVVLIPQNVVFHSVALIPQHKIFIKLHEKYQKGNIFGFCKMLKNTNEIPDN